MHARRLRNGILAAMVGSGLVLVGCELIVDFDRTKIPIEDAGSVTTDAPATDAPVTDAPAETGGDGGDAGDAADANDASDAEDGSDADADV
jgi:hypothetical protein